MIVDTIYDEIEFITETDSVTFPDADKLRGINIDQGEALSLMLYAQGYRKVKEGTYTTDLLTNQEEYILDTDWVKPTAFYVKYTAGGDYVKCKMYDVDENEKSEMDIDMINGTFSQTSPYVRFTGDAFYIRPVNTGTTVSDGLSVIAEPRNTDLASTTATPILDPIFHRWYVLKQALRFGKFRPGVTRGDIELELQQLEKRIRGFYSERLKTPTKLKTPTESFK